MNCLVTSYIKINRKVIICTVKNVKNSGHRLVNLTVHELGYMELCFGIVFFACEIIKKLINYFSVIGTF